MKIPFYIVDVFTNKKYAGNQLGVYLNAVNLSHDEMLAMAKETNFQESTFVLSGEQRDGGYDVRIFTPEYEIPFAGHPTIGTAYVIKNFVQQSPSETIVLNLKVGQVPVQQEGDVLWLTIKNPQFKQQFAHAEIAPLLGLEVSDLDTTLPIEIVSTGLPFMIIPVKTIDALKRIKFSPTVEDWMKANRLHTSNSENGLNIYFFMFAQEAEEAGNHIHARMIGSENGVMREDSATGSANSCMLAYLLQHTANQVDLNVEQGYEMGRPSLIKIRGSKSDGQFNLQVGGQVVEVAEGSWHV
jgi:trans-2,3-dihydro-3-hydroxyanthranilate isomerase